MPQLEGDFHVVRRRKFFRRPSGNVVLRAYDYQVYCNNVPFLKGAGKNLSRREAQWITDILNKRFTRVHKYNKVKKAAA